MLSIRILTAFLCTLLLSGLEAISQAGDKSWVTYSSSGGIENTVSIVDQNGKAFANPSEDVTGSPFFLSEWTYGTIRLHDSTGFTNIRLRLNLLSQEVHYLDRAGVEKALPKGFIREIVLKDSAARGGPKDYVFRCGFPPVDNQDNGSFYRILTSGKLTLLGSVRKVLVTTTNGFSGEEKKEFREYDDYYVFAQGTMQRWKNDKATLLAHMSDQQDKVSTFIETNKINFKSIDDIGRLIAYYNSLP